jgi:uncharacterized protein with ATP-grasp and redox domains
MIDRPAPLMTSELGSFARSTIVERKPQIIGQVMADNGYPPDIVAALEAFRHEIATQPIQPLTEVAPDTEFWNQQAAVYRGRTWLELPWYFAETYFYRRLLEAVRYLQPGPWQDGDPFAPQKRRQEEEAVAFLAQHWTGLSAADPQTRFEALLHSSLWGNRADLSNLTVRESARGGLDAPSERHNILIDHSQWIATRLSTGVSRLDLVTDNVGRELLFDLALAEFVLDQGWAASVVFHLKDRPFFVSDAMPRDAEQLLALLANEDLGRQLEAHRLSGRLVFTDHPFWSRCLMYRDMPEDVAADLGQSSLVLLKGDVNYRRLLDDAHWPYTARVEEIAAYFPASFAILRTLKGEIMVGLAPGQAETLAAADPGWLINGKRGIIQLVSKP